MAIIAVHHTRHGPLHRIPEGKFESVPRGFPSGDLFSWIPTGYKGVVQVASACHTEILEIPCLVLSQKMVLFVSFDKLLVELAQAAGPSLAALAWSCSFRNLHPRV